MNVKLRWPAHSNALITSSILFLTFKHENAILNVCLIVTLSPRIPDAKCLALWNYNKRLFIFITDLGTDNHYSTLEHCIFCCVQFYKPIILDDVYFMCVVCIISWGLPQIIIPVTKVLGLRPASGSPKRPDLTTCHLKNPIKEMNDGEARNDFILIWTYLEEQGLMSGSETLFSGHWR